MTYIKKIPKRKINTPYLLIDPSTLKIDFF